MPSAGGPLPKAENLQESPMMGNFPEFTIRACSLEIFPFLSIYLLHFIYIYFFVLKASGIHYLKDNDIKGLRSCCRGHFPKYEEETYYGICLDHLLNGTHPPIGNKLPEFFSNQDCHRKFGIPSYYL